MKRRAELTDMLLACLLVRTFSESKWFSSSVGSISSTSWGRKRINILPSCSLMSRNVSENTNCHSHVLDIGWVHRQWTTNLKKETSKPLIHSMEYLTNKLQTQYSSIRISWYELTNAGTLVYRPRPCFVINYWKVKLFTHFLKICNRLLPFYWCFILVTCLRRIATVKLLFLTSILTVIIERLYDAKKFQRKNALYNGKNLKFSNFYKKWHISAILIKAMLNQFTYERLLQRWFQAKNCKTFEFQ